MKFSSTISLIIIFIMFSNVMKAQTKTIQINENHIFKWLNFQFLEMKEELIKKIFKQELPSYKDWGFNHSGKWILDSSFLQGCVLIKLATDPNDPYMLIDTFTKFEIYLANIEITIDQKNNILILERPAFNFTDKEILDSKRIYIKWDEALKFIYQDQKFFIHLFLINNSNKVLINQKTLFEFSKQIFENTDSMLCKCTQENKYQLYTNNLTTYLGKQEIDSKLFYETTEQIQVDPNDPYNTIDSSKMVEYIFLDTGRKNNICCLLRMEENQMNLKAISTTWQISNVLPFFYPFGWIKAEDMYIEHSLHILLEKVSIYSWLNWPNQTNEIYMSEYGDFINLETTYWDEKSKAYKIRCKLSTRTSQNAYHYMYYQNYYRSSAY